MAVDGEPLDAMVSNLGQTDNSYVSIGGTSSKVASQGFTTGSSVHGYRLQGIGVNVEGSDDTNADAQIPGGPSSVSVSVHAGLNGKPGARLFDLVSPDEYAAGELGFFEAPAGTSLEPDTSYVMVWRHNSGTNHRLQQTTGDSEDPDGLAGFSLADAFHVGADLGSLTADSQIVGTDTVSNALEIAVYGEAIGANPFVAGGNEVDPGWIHMPEGVRVGDQFQAGLRKRIGQTDATSADIEVYKDLVRDIAAGTYSDPVLQRFAGQFKAVVCTAAADAREHTGMTEALGVPVHWLDGGWEDRPHADRQLVPPVLRRRVDEQRQGRLSHREHHALPPERNDLDRVRTPLETRIRSSTWVPAHP